MDADLLKERFNAKWKEAPNGCWEWTASVAGKGYGQFRIPGTRRNAYAHRLSYELNIGPIPDGMMVCHRCDNPKCVNPEHLFLGDATVNLTDMAEKGRHLYGERNTEVKLTEQQVHAIHEIGSSMIQRDVAKMFGVGQMTISRILRGERWKHVYEARRRGNSAPS